MCASSSSSSSSRPRRYQPSDRHISTIPLVLVLVLVMVLPLSHTLSLSVSQTLALTHLLAFILPHPQHLNSNTASYAVRAQRGNKLPRVSTIQFQWPCPPPPVLLPYTHTSPSSAMQWRCPDACPLLLHYVFKNRKRFRRRAYHLHENHASTKSKKKKLKLKKDTKTQRHKNTKTKTIRKILKPEWEIDPFQISPMKRYGW